MTFSSSSSAGSILMAIAGLALIASIVVKQFGRVRFFVNGENLTGVRQTRSDPLLRPTQAVDGRWTVDAWAPLEGRNINGGLRVRF